MTQRQSLASPRSRCETSISRWTSANHGCSVGGHEVEDTLVDRAPVVFCLGGAMSAETAEQVVALAARMGAGVGGTEEAVREGIVPALWVLGILNRAIAPRLCVAIGVVASGFLAPVQATEHHVPALTIVNYD